MDKVRVTVAGQRIERNIRLLLGGARSYVANFAVVKSLAGLASDMAAAVPPGWTAPQSLFFKAR